jgi:chemotaxis protein MotB
LLAGGSGSGDASHVIKGGGQDLTRSPARSSAATSRPAQDDQPARAEGRTGARRTARLEELKEKVEKKIAANRASWPACQSQIKLDMTRDGLRIQIVDDQNRPMFDSGSAVVKPYMRDLLREIGKVLAEVPNRLTLEGHTDALPFGGGDRGYSNWELSADRANASRRELVAGGLPDDRVLRVQGLAASQPFDRKSTRGPGQPAHQHHRDEPRGRGPRLPHPPDAAEPPPCPTRRAAAVNPASRPRLKSRPPAFDR